MAFLPADEAQRARAKALVDEDPGRGGHIEVLGWREVPTEPIGSGVGQTALDVMPAFEQLFLAAPRRPDGTRAARASHLDRLVYPARKRIEHDTRGRRASAIYFPRCPAAPWSTRAC